VNFAQYLLSKKIDPDAFKRGEPVLYNTWDREFEQMNESSFTVQKLNLINPIRRKYQLKQLPQEPSIVVPPQVAATQPKPGRPVMKPKPKLD
jgi:hypothetical protein